ncbi:MAG: hypothetical protein AAB394_03605 [Patescibacteria group bacterium]
MPSGPEIIRGYGDQKKEDHSVLFSEDEKPKNGSPETLSDADLEGMLENYDLVVEEKSKDINAEQVARVWNRFFSEFEKKLVFQNEAEFERLLEKYKKSLETHEKNESEIVTKIGVIRSLHKLVKEKDPRAALIENPL